MLEVLIIDENLDAACSLQELLQKKIVSFQFNNIYQINLRVVGFSDFLNSSVPDLIVISHSCISPIAKLQKIKSTFNFIPIIIITDRQLSFIEFEKIIVSGVSEVVNIDIEPEDFFKKITVHIQAKKYLKKANIVVVASGKGASGVSSITAALGEALVEQNKKVLLIDLDSNTQDLSRFLQIRPYVNENLTNMITGDSSISEENILNSVSRVWSNCEHCDCMSPAFGSSRIYSDIASRNTALIMQMLCSLYDYIVVDCAEKDSEFAKTLLQNTDTLLYLIGSDPASVFSAVDGFMKLQKVVPKTCSKLFLENLQSARSISSAIQDEILACVDVSTCQWLECALPSCSYARIWPASGMTMYSCGSAKIRSRLRELSCKISGEVKLISVQETFSVIIKEFFSKNKFKKQTKLAEKTLSLPMPEDFDDKQEAAQSPYITQPVWN